MSERHDDPSPLDLELAALGEASPERLAELKGLGHGDTIRALEAQHDDFHQLHDRDAMLRQIELRHQRLTHETDMHLTINAHYSRPLLLGAGVVALCAGLFALASYDTQAPSSGDVTRSEPLATVEPIDPVGAPVVTPPRDRTDGVCDTSRRWTAAERTAEDPEPPEALNAYTQEMFTCLERGVRAIQDSWGGFLLEPPRELVHACRQHFGFACAALGTLELTGTGPFKEGYLSRESFVLDPTATAWTWGEHETRTPRVTPELIAGESLPAATTFRRQPIVTCDMSRKWSKEERDATHEDSVMLASPYRQSMLACLVEGLDAFSATLERTRGRSDTMGASSHTVPAELEYACTNHFSTACSMAGLIQLEGRYIHGGNATVDYPPTESRVRGARHLRRSCALNNVSACAVLARYLSEDATVREATGYEPSVYTGYSNPMFDGWRGDPDVYIDLRTMTTSP